MSSNIVKKIAFIACVDYDEYFRETCLYINRLIKPENVQYDIIEIRDVNKSADGFAEANQAVEADVKVYIRQDAFIVDDLFIGKVLAALEADGMNSICVPAANKPEEIVAIASCQPIAWDSSLENVELFSKIAEKLCGKIENDISIVCDFAENRELSEDESLRRDLSFFMRRAEYSLPYYDYKELIDCVADGTISMELAKSVADEYCMQPLAAFESIEKGITGMRYDSLIEKVAPKPAFNLNWYRNKDTYTDGAIEDAIIQFFAEENTGYYSKAYANNPQWAAYYHLTHIRRNILNWYPFKGTERVLEIGCGMGAITGVLCEKCEQVTAVELSKQRATATLFRNKERENLEIIVANLNDIPFEEKFDVITLIGVFEYQGKYTNSSNPYIDFLEKMKSLLKPDGKLFIAIENQFGLKYWCGAREDHTSGPFDGINRYRFNKGGVRTFSKAELENMLHKSGFESTYFYYPLPDYKLPTEIYSQDYLPKKGSLDNMGFYYAPNSDSLVALEKDLYNDVIENGAFEFMANSFLVECSLKDLKEDKRIYSALSSDRLREYQVGTSFDSAGLVHKYPLFPEGARHISNTAYNTDRLEKTGITVWKTEHHNGQLTNEFCKKKTADAVLTERYEAGDVEGVLALFDALYAEVLKTSGTADASANLILSSGSSKDKNKNYGPVLKQASIDMIFRNAFYEDGKFIWFDQEWQLENVPAKYVVYRAIANYYTKNKWVTHVLSLDDIIKHCEMTGVWEDFVSLDRAFCNSVVDYDYLKVKHIFEDSSAEKCKKKSFELLNKN